MLISFARPVLPIVMVLTGCASGELSARGASDPSNPAAPETPTIALPPEPAPDMPASGDHVHAGADAGSVIYACPMHPEVMQPTPGKCPKCGMELRPKSGP